MKVLSVVFLCLSAAGCETTEMPFDPSGAWDLTLTFSTGTCPGLAATFAINFDVTKFGSGEFAAIVFTPSTRIAHDDLSGSFACGYTSCALEFHDNGPESEDGSVRMQSIFAMLDEDAERNLAGTGTTELELDDYTLCSPDFAAVGNVN